MTNTITEALQAAIDMIATERQEFADCAERHDGTLTAADATILREYDDVLAKLHAALAEHTSMAEEIERLRAEANTPTIFWGDDWNAARGIGDSLYEVIESAFDDVTAVAGPRYVRVGRARELPAITVRAWIDGEGALQWEKAHDDFVCDEYSKEAKR